MQPIAYSLSRIDHPLATSSLRRGPSLAAQAHAAISELIISGQIAPGERVVIERLAERLAVSQTPVREAVARLTQEGLVVEAAGGRLRVVELDERYVREVFLVRGGLEGLCVELATPRVPEAALAALRAVLDRTGPALARGDAELYSRSDAMLHQIVQAANNRILLNELRSLQPHIDLIRSYSQRNNGAHLAASHREHLLVVAALERRDAQAARRSMEQHIRAAGERIVRLIEF